MFFVTNANKFYKAIMKYKQKFVKIVKKNNKQKNSFCKILMENNSFNKMLNIRTSKTELKI